jgi:hypothetical protein
MQSLVDFLSFKTFISPSILLGCYYFGALGFPFVFALFVVWARWKYKAQDMPAQETIAGKSFLWQWVTLPNKALVMALFVLMWLCMEIMWRMMFEFMLAYFQMRDALLGLS